MLQEAFQRVVCDVHAAEPDIGCDLVDLNEAGRISGVGDGGQYLFVQPAKELRFGKDPSSPGVIRVELERQPGLFQGGFEFSLAAKDERQDGDGLGIVRRKTCS